MVVDLVSPWCSAVEAPDADRACAAFRSRHAGWLDALVRQRTPHLDTFPLETDTAALRAVALHAADPLRQQRLHDAVTEAADLGTDRCEVVLFPRSMASGTDMAEPLPQRTIALFLGPEDDERSLVVALAGALVASTRWSMTAGGQRRTPAGWNRWDAARELPLRDWIYSAGLGVHLALALVPGLEPHEVLGLGRTAFARLRRRERILTPILERDLDQAGIGLVLRWLAAASPSTARGPDGVLVPPMAGHYLAWRMLAERVGRVGIREAIRMAA